MRKLIFLCTFLLPFLVGPAWAFDCASPVVDAANVISDPGKVAAAIRSVSGYNVFVRTYSVLPFDQTLKQQVEADSKACKNWRNGSGSNLANNLIVVSYAVTGNNIAIDFGVDAEPKLGHGKYVELLRSYLAPGVKSYVKNDKDGLTRGFATTISAMGAVLASNGAAISVHQATDLGGLWKVMGWLVVLLALGIAGLLYLRWAKAETERKAAQAEARHARSLVVGALNQLNRSMTILGAKASNVPDLMPLMSKFRLLVTGGNATLSTFDNASGEDPNDARLSVDVYRSNQKLYEALLRENVNPANDLQRQIEQGFPDVVERPKPADPVIEPPVDETPEPQAPFIPAQPYVPPSSFSPEPTSQFRAPPQAPSQFQAPAAPPAPFPWSQPPRSQAQNEYVPPPAVPVSAPAPSSRYSEGLVEGIAIGAVGDELLRPRDHARSQESEDRYWHNRERADEDDRQQRRNADQDQQQDRDDDQSSGGGYSVNTAPSYTAPAPAPSYTAPEPTQAQRDDDDGGGYSVNTRDDDQDTGGGFSVDTSSSSSSSSSTDDS